MNTSNVEPVVELLARNQPLFKALGDMARQEILIILACEERLTVGELARKTALSRPAISHHLRILKQAGLLRETREGVRRYYHPTFEQGIISTKLLIDEILKTKELL